MWQKRNMCIQIKKQSKVKHQTREESKARDWNTQTHSRWTARKVVSLTKQGSIFKAEITGENEEVTWGKISRKFWQFREKSMQFYDALFLRRERMSFLRTTPAWVLCSYSSSFQVLQDQRRPTAVVVVSDEEQEREEGQEKQVEITLVFWKRPTGVQKVKIARLSAWIEKLSFLSKKRRRTSAWSVQSRGEGSLSWFLSSTTRNGEFVTDCILLWLKDFSWEKT